MCKFLISSQQGTFRRFLQTTTNNEQHQQEDSNHWNDWNNRTHVPHQHQAMEDEDVPVFLKILAAAWIIFMVLVCYKAEQRELQEDARRAEQRRRRREQRIRQRKFAPGRRKTAVAAAIVTKKMTDNSGAGVMDQGDHLQEDNEDMTCTICLEPFEAGQDLSFSRDLKCHHCFHRDCLIPWMMRNDDCPMCRTCLVEDDGKEDLNDLDFDDEEDLVGEGFRIVNGLVRFAAMLGHDHHHALSFGNNTHDDNTEVVVQEVELTEVVVTGATVDESEDRKKKGRKKKRRKGDRRDYSALSIGDNIPVTTDVEIIQQQDIQEIV